MMNFKKTLALILTLPAMTLLAACGGGSNNNSQPIQYGQLGSTTLLNFNSSASQQIPALQTALNTAVNIGNNTTLLAESQAPGLGFYVNNIASHALSLGVNHVNAYAITYNTPGVNPRYNPADVNRTVSGLVLVPVQANGSLINNPKGIVVFYHPTEPEPSSVPSCLTSNLISNTPAYCNPINSSPYSEADGDTYYNELAAVYAAAGYIVIAPDYIGQGIDTSTLHPYVFFPKVDADSGLYMISAARTMLAQQNILSTSVPLNLFITGFSEGGGYALSASQQAQTTLGSYLASQNVNLKMTAPAEGPYDVPEQMNFDFANLQDGVYYCTSNPQDPTDITPITCSGAPSTYNIWNVESTAYAAYVKPLLMGLSLTTMGYYVLNNETTAYETLMYPDYFNVSIGGSSSATLVQLFTSPTYTNGEIALYILLNSYNLINNNVYYGGGVSASTIGENNSMSAFTDANIQTNPLVQQLIASASTYQWVTYSPIDFIHMNYDSAVTVANYAAAYPYMQSLAKPGLVTQTTIQNTSIANYSACASSSNTTTFCEANPGTTISFPVSPGTAPTVPIDHSASGPFMYIGALCAFEHAQGLTNICA